MNNEYLDTKRRRLENAWRLMDGGRFPACRKALREMDPEMRDCEEYHATWLSTLIFAERWKETEEYARPLVAKHGGYCRTFYNALINGVCGQGRFGEGLEFVEEAIAHWPSDGLFRALKQSIQERISRECE